MLGLTIMMYYVPFLILLFLVTVLCVLNKYFRRQVLMGLVVCLMNCGFSSIVGLLFGTDIAAAVFVNLLFLSICISSLQRVIRYTKYIRTGCTETGSVERIQVGINRTVVHITYNVDGNVYEFRQHEPLSWDRSVQWVTVFYNPQKPKFACTESGWIRSLLILCFTAVLFLCILALTLCGFYVF